MMQLPENCLQKEKKSCEPLAQLEDDEGGFICIGKIQKRWMKDIPEQDNYCFCWKGEGIDEMSFVDKRDLIDTISVIAQALSVIENIENY